MIVKRRVLIRQMNSINTLLKKKCDFPRRYYWRHYIDKNVLWIRPILREDMQLALSLDSDTKVQEFLMARCINQVDSFSRDNLGFEDWYNYIDSLNYKKKYLYMQRLRVITYKKFYKDRKFPIYF